MEWLIKVSLSIALPLADIQIRTPHGAIVAVRPDLYDISTDITQAYPCYHSFLIHALEPLRAL